ncbi:MAG: hypothetical protein KDA60_06845, partial [Planctomycetales bacterium]|nr:hypothetical protein [Planctomycetales bacterium]
MTDTAGWWKSSALIALLMGIPIVIAGLQPSVPVTNGHVVNRNGSPGVPSPVAPAVDTPVKQAVAEELLGESAGDAAANTNDLDSLEKAEATPAAEIDTAPDALPARTEASPTLLAAADTLNQVAAPAESSPSDENVAQEPPAEGAPSEPVAPVEALATEQATPVQPSPESTPLADAGAREPITTESSSDPELAEWRADVDESLRKAMLSEILVRLAGESESIDSKIIEIEKLQREI